MQETYSDTALLAYIAWLVISIFIFAQIPLRKALLVFTILGTMFLPIISIRINELPDFNKEFFINLTLLLSCIITRIRGKYIVRDYKFSYFDLTVIIYIFCYNLTAIENELGLYEGFSETLGRMIIVGIPYFIGRFYFSDTSSHKDIATYYLHLTFLYLPLCLYELRFSPQLHNSLYGYHQHSFIQSIREGVWRPTVFMEHGLVVSLWLSLATLIGVWLFKTKVINNGFTLIGIITMGAVTIISQSWGAILLLLIGLICLYTSHFLKKGLPLIILFIFPSLYLANRISNLKLETNAIEAARGLLPLRRFRSMTFRIEQEYKLVRKANEKMLLGWGRFGRARIYEDGKDVSITDSEWIIQYGQGGLLSLLPFILIFTFPAIGLYKTFLPSIWHTKSVAPSAALAIGLGAVLVDLMLNSSISTIHFIIAGALSNPYLSKQKVSVISFTNTPNSQ